VPKNLDFFPALPLLAPPSPPSLLLCCVICVHVTRCRSAVEKTKRLNRQQSSANIGRYVRAERFADWWKTDAVDCAGYRCWRLRHVWCVGDHECRQNEYRCSMERELADTAAYAPSRRCVCSPDGSTCSAWNSHGRHLEIITSYQKSDFLNRSVCKLEEQSRQLSSRSNLKRGSLGLFWRGRPKRQEL